MMSSAFGLPVINFFMADVGGGMGPFLSAWLSQSEHWPPDRIGLVLSAGLVAGMFMAIPAGGLIDRLGRPRLMLALTCVLILGGTLAMIWLRGLWPILVAQIVVATGGALGVPALTALTMATVGKRAFPRQQGSNEAAAHAGNVAAAILIWAATFVIGPDSSLAVLGLMAVGMLLALSLYPRGALDQTRMDGRDRQKAWDKHERPRALLRNYKLLILILAIGVFNFGNAAVLPLLAQRIGLEGKHDATQWLAILVVVAQVVMVPVSWTVGRLADKVGRRILLILACAVLPIRGLLAACSHNLWALIAIEVLDGVGAGIISVAGPAAVADLTYGGGRTQTAMGAMGTVQSLASALSASAAGFMVVHMGWAAAYGMLGIVPLIGIALLWTVQLRDETPETAPDRKTKSFLRADAEV